MHLFKMMNALAQCCSGDDRNESVGAVMADSQVASRFRIEVSTTDSYPKGTKGVRLPCAVSAAAAAAAAGAIAPPTVGDKKISSLGVAVEAQAVSGCIELVVGSVCSSWSQVAHDCRDIVDMAVTGFALQALKHTAKALPGGKASSITPGRKTYMTS